MSTKKEIARRNEEYRENAKKYRYCKFVPFLASVRPEGLENWQYGLYDEWTWERIFSYGILLSGNIQYPDYRLSGPFIKVGFYISSRKEENGKNYCISVTGADDSVWNNYFTWDDACRIYKSISTLTLQDIEELGLEC